MINKSQDFSINFLDCSKKINVEKIFLKDLLQQIKIYYLRSLHKLFIQNKLYHIFKVIGYNN